MYLSIKLHLLPSNVIFMSFHVFSFQLPQQIPYFSFASGLCRIFPQAVGARDSSSSSQTFPTSSSTQGISSPHVALPLVRCAFPARNANHDMHRIIAAVKRGVKVPVTSPSYGYTSTCAFLPMLWNSCRFSLLPTALEKITIYNEFSVNRP